MAQSEAHQVNVESSPAKRFVSVDALRGFDMFWILGADTLARSIPLTTGELARKVSGEAAEELTGFNRLLYIIAEQLEHVSWDGFHFYDLIFPMFVFLMGVSTVFSLDRIVAKHGKGRAYRRVIFRAIVLYALGILYHGARGEPPACGPRRLDRRLRSRQYTRRGNRVAVDPNWDCVADVSEQILHTRVIHESTRGAMHDHTELTATGRSDTAAAFRPPLRQAFADSIWLEWRTQNEAARHAAVQAY